MTTLDATVHNVTGRRKVFVLYIAKGEPLTVDGLVAFIKPLPRGAIVLVDLEPLPDPDRYEKILRIAHVARKDVKISVYGTPEFHRYGSLKVRTGMKTIAPSFEPQRAMTDRYSLAMRTQGLFEGLLETADSRELNDRHASLLSACDYVLCTYYPPADVQPGEIGSYIDDLAGEGYRVGKGKPLMLMVSACIDVDHTRVPWTGEQLADLTAALARNRFTYAAVWDGNLATSKQDKANAEAVRKAMSK